ncbi:MAG: DUF1049 domain-containing protein [Rhizobiaceae bacterium]
MKRLVALLLLVPIGIVIIALAIANRQAVHLSLPAEFISLLPSSMQSGYAPLAMPLFALLFATLLVGMVIGSIVTWLKQGKHRKQARIQRAEATKMAYEAEKQKSKADQMNVKLSDGEMSSEQKAFTALGLPAPKTAA